MKTASTAPACAVVDEHQFELFSRTVLLAPATRAVTACYEYGETIDPGANDCEAHPGCPVVEVIVWRPVRFRCSDGRSPPPVATGEARRP